MNSNRGFNSGRGSGIGGKLYNQFSTAPRHQQVLSVVVTLLVIVLVVYLVIRLVNSYKSFHARNVKVIPGTIRMDDQIVIDGKELPESVDQRYGVEFSYANWMYIKDLNSGSTLGKKPLRHVYHKGSAHVNPTGSISNGDIGAVQAPGVWLDGSTNNLMVLMNTFPVGGAQADQSVFEVAEVKGVPMNTWFHLAVVCINKNIDVFINGRLKMRKTLKGLPRLNYGNLYVGGDSYRGNLSNMYYFAHALQIFEIDRLVAEGPAQVIFKSPEFNEAQIAPDWYLSTGYPRN